MLFSSGMVKPFTKHRYIDPALISNIIQSVNIVDYIGHFIELRSGGGSFEAPCPFHKETKPSFKVSPRLQIYKCFGCGEAGNVITFAMHYFGKSYYEAVKDVADFFSISIPETKAQKAYMKRIGSLYQLCEEAKNFYQNRLIHPKTETAEKALRALEMRGINNELIKKFGFGVADDNYFDTNFLINHFKDEYSNDKEVLDKLVDVGLLRKKGKYKNPFFRQRLMIPLKNQYNQVVGFSGRTIPGVDYGSFNPPKYLNSPKGILFKKEEILSGISDLNHLGKLDEIFIVEGPFDYFTFKIQDINNCVFTNGTALTEKHLKKLSRYTNKLVFCFDADEAGLKATIRGAKLALKDYFEVSVVNISSVDRTGLDPEEFINKHGSERFFELVKLPEEIFDFLLQEELYLINLDNIDSKVLPKLKNSIFPFIDSCNSVVKVSYLKKLATKLDTPYEGVKDIYCEYLEGSQGYFNKGRFSVEQKLLSFITASSHHREIAINKFSPNNFSNIVNKVFFEYITLDKNILSSKTSYTPHMFGHEQNLFAKQSSGIIIDDFKDYCKNKNISLSDKEIIEISNIILDANPANNIILDVFKYQLLERQLKDAEIGAIGDFVDFSETKVFLKFYDQTYKEFLTCKKQIKQKIQNIENSEKNVPLEELITGLR